MLNKKLSEEEKKKIMEQVLKIDDKNIKTSNSVEIIRKSMMYYAGNNRNKKI